MSTFKNLVKTTDSRSEFNRAYKRYLEHSGKIRCDRCTYHHGENSTDKPYGTKRFSRDDDMRYPSWKLVSKNKKQWMKKPIKIIKEHVNRCHGYYDWYVIKFPT